MINISMPKGASYIIDKLYAHGYEAYIVGGCVRDALLSKTADDYDITTDASPDEIKLIFEKTIDTGIAHGTVTVISYGKPYEVTTYRIDGDYKDKRHPSSVIYTKTLKEDLSRRDFTVNAMAYNDKVGLVDEFEGINDLKSRVIRTVNNPEKRFTEDALRVLRGIRFSSVLDFNIEEKTSDAIKKLAPNLAFVSAERIFTEWKKLLSGTRSYEIIKEYFEVIRIFIPELTVCNLPPKTKFDALTPLEKMISLFVYNGKKEAYLSMSKRLKTDSKTRDIGSIVLNNLLEKKCLSDIDIKLFMQGLDDDAAVTVAKISEAYGLCDEGITVRIKNLIKLNTPRKISDLNVGGSDLLKEGVKGRQIGEILKELLMLVAKEKIKNDKNELISYVIKEYKS